MASFSETAFAKTSAFDEFAWSFGEFVEPPAPPPSENRGAGKSRRTKRRLQVEIEGTVFAVESAEEADALIAQAREVAEQKAAEDARTVVRKRRTAARRDRKPLRLDSIQLDTPYVKAVSDESAELAQRIQAQLDAVYAAAAQEAELALHMYMARLRDEEEALLLILLD